MVCQGRELSYASLLRPFSPAGPLGDTKVLVIGLPKTAARWTGWRRPVPCWSAGEFNGWPHWDPAGPIASGLFSMTKCVPRVRRFGEPAFCGYVAPRIPVKGGLAGLLMALP